MPDGTFNGVEVIWGLAIAGLTWLTYYASKKRRIRRPPRREITITTPTLERLERMGRMLDEC